MTAKRVLMVIVLFFLGMPLFGQTFDLSSVPMLKRMKVEYDVYDQAKYRVFYKYLHQVDKEDSTYKKEGITILKLGEEYNSFMDYNTYRRDSILKLSEGKEDKDIVQAFNTALSLGKKRIFQQKILLGLKNKSIITQERIGKNNVVCVEDFPAFEWKLISGDTIISGYECKKAAMTFRGRDYVAWYSEEVPMPYGPYKFGGLPGLIFSIYDTARHHVFTLIGLNAQDVYDPIYNSGGHYQEIEREKALKMNKNYHADPTREIMASGSVTIASEDLATIKSKSLPFNPIELE